MENPVPHTYSYSTVAVSQTDQLLGNVGAVGDLLERLIISVATPATSTCSIKDGNGSAIVIMAATVLAGTYTVELRMRARATTTPGWRITTGAGCTAIAVGKFT